MKTALLVSPHLDDAVFSCGGIAARLARQGWRVVIATLFTRSVHPPTGFALACQRDKGLSDDVDYMALRRKEDAAAAAILNVETLHLDLPEAPHRGYDCAAALFKPPRADDHAVEQVADALAATISALTPALILAPQGCGRHVDHMCTIDAILNSEISVPLGFYGDTPYIIRDPAASPHTRVASAAPTRIICRLDPAELALKQRAACRYESQIMFQFGGEAAAHAALASLAMRHSDKNGLAEELVGRNLALAELLGI